MQLIFFWYLLDVSLVLVGGILCSKKRAMFSRLLWTKFCVTYFDDPDFCFIKYFNFKFSEILTANY